MTNIQQWPGEVHVIGVGGIGTHVVLALIELGVPSLHLWDDDVVELHNRPSQPLYRRKDVGSPKVEAALQYTRRQEHTTVVTIHQERVTPATRLPGSGIVIGCVDTMKSRQDIWKIVKNNPFVPLYIDSRIGGNELQVHTLNPSNPDLIERYEMWLAFSDSDVPDLGCITRENPFCAQGVAQHVSINLALFAKGERLNDFIHRNLRAEAVKQDQQTLIAT